MRKILASLILALICHASFGQAGSLDPSFGDNGIVRNNFVLSNTSGNTCRQILLHPDGSFYLVFDMNGQTFVTHRLANGTVDAGYGENGYSVPVRMTGPSAEMQPDGKIVAGGTVIVNGGKDFVVARFNTNGSLDNSFSGDGIQLLDFATRDDVMSSLVLQPDDKIVTAGSTMATTGYSDFALARFNTDGSPDNSFSGDARVITELTGNAIVDVGLQNNGRIIGVGVTHNAGSSMTVVCYTPDGNLDNTFGTGGKKNISNCESKTILVQPDNKILV
ncbi:MAG TPA: delta-60 repeat domain-containing protein, partial [Chitinophagaceae bacterium]